MLRGCLLVAGILTIRVQGHLSYELFHDDGHRGEPIPVAIAWYLKKAKSVTIETYYDDESLLAARYLERFLEELNEKCETAILLIRQAGLSSAEAASRAKLDRKSSVYHTEASIALIADDAYFHEYLDSMAMQLGNKQKLVAILWVPDQDLCATSEDLRRRVLTQHLRNIWEKRKILNVLLSIPMADCLRDSLFRLDTFAVDEDGERGSLKSLKVNAEAPHLHESLNRFLDDLSDMKELPLTVSMFERFPTAVDIASGKSSLRNFEPHYSHFAGVDSFMLQVLAENMNFSVELFQHNDGYGYRAPNGTLVGMMGNIANGQIDLSMNGMFVKDYDDSGELTFTATLTSDRMCIVVPRRGKIPRWMNIFQSFRVSVWIGLMLVVFGCSVIRYFIGYATRENSGHGFVGELIESTLMFLGSPTKLPERAAGRIFIGFFLLFGVIVIGILQCNMSGSLSNPSWFKDIDTLEELDASGYPISTNSPNLKSLFNDNDENSVLANLRGKIQIPDSGEGSNIERAAARRDVAALGRENDVRVPIDSTFVNDQGDKLLHMVSDCLATYHLAYAVPNNSYLLGKIDTIIRRSVEAGLLNREYSETQRAIVMEARSKMTKLEEQRTKSAAFSMQDVQVAFAALACGLILSTVVFVIEKLGWSFGGARSMSVRGLRRVWKRNV